MAGVGEVQHRPRPGGRRGGRGDQDGAGAAARRAAARRCTPTSRRRTWTGRPGAVRLLTEPVPWPATASRAGRGVLVRHQRHQRPRHPRRSPRRRGTGLTARGRRRRSPVLAGDSAGCDAWLVSGADGGGAAGAGGPAGRARWRRGRSWIRRTWRWSLAATRSVFEHRAVVLGDGPGGAAGGPGRGGGGRARARGGDRVRCRRAAGQGGVRVPRARAASGRGWAGSWPRAARCSRPGWPSAARRWPRTWTGRWRTCWPGRPGAPGLERGRGGAAGAVGGDGVAGRGLAGGRGDSRTRWWATPRARSPPRPWPGS